MIRLLAYLLILAGAATLGTLLAHFSGYLPLSTRAAGIVGGIATGVPFVTAGFVARRLLQ